MRNQSTENDATRHYRRDLVGLSPNGLRCEACGRHMHDHEWADLDFNGFVTACVYSPGREANR